MPSQDPTVSLRLTVLETSVLRLAAESIAEDIDSYGLSAQEKAAFGRARDKLRTSLWGREGD